MNRNIVFRILSVALALMMFLVCLAGCANNGANPAETNGDTNGDTNTDTEEESSGPELSGNTYDYKKFTILLRENGGVGGMYFDDQAIELIGTNSSFVDQAVYERNKTVSDLLHVTLYFSNERLDGSTIRDKVHAAAAAMSDAYDLIATHGQHIFSWAQDGIFLDWNKLPTVNLDAEWYNQSAVENWATPGGKIFAMIGDISYQSAVGSASAMYFNQALIEGAELTSPYEYVKNGTDGGWTLENFTALVKDLASTVKVKGDNSGPIGTDAFAYATNYYRGPGGYFALSAGELPLVFNRETDEYEMGFTNRTIDAMDDYLGFIRDGRGDYIYYSGEMNDINSLRSAFKDGRVAFVDDNVWSATNFVSTDVRYGIVPIPKYESTDEYVSFSGSGSNTFAVMKNSSSENITRISDVVEALSYYGNQIVIPKYFDTVLSLQSVVDPDARDMLQLIRANMACDLSEYLKVGNVSVCGTTALHNNTSFKTELDKISGGLTIYLQLWLALDDSE